MPIVRKHGNTVTYRDGRTNHITVTYLILHFLNLLAVEHVEIFVAADVVALHLILILLLVMCLKTKIKSKSKEKSINSAVYDKIRRRSQLTVYSYISEIFKYRVHLELGRVTVVDAETSGFLIVVLVHFLQQRQTITRI